MPLSPEDVASIQEMINTGLMPQVEKLVEEKVTSGLSGLTDVVQGLLNQKPETGEGAGANPQMAGVLGILGALAPVLVQVLPMLKGHQQTDPMGQFNQMAAMMRTSSEVMLAPVMDIWRQGMAFGVQAVSVAQRVTGPVDAAAFQELIVPQPTKGTAQPQPQPQNGQMNQSFDYEAHASKAAGWDKGY